MNEEIQNQENEEVLSQAAFQGYLNHFIGKDQYGDPRAVGTYQLFASEDEEGSRERETIYKISKATYSLRHSKTHPGFIAMDIVFNAYDDTELKLLWSRLKKFEDNQIKDPEKTWILHFTLLDTGSLSEESEKEDVLLIAHLVNPVMSYLTREMPTDQVEERAVNNERVGGNTVRMLFTTAYVSLEQTAKYNTPQLKAEIERERMSSEYLDNYEPPEDDGVL